MLRPERGSLAERSDFRGKVKHLCEKTRFLNGNLEFFSDDNIVTAPRNVSIKLSPLDVSICSTTSGRTTRENSAPNENLLPTNTTKCYNNFNPVTQPKPPYKIPELEPRNSSRQPHFPENIAESSSDYESSNSFNKTKRKANFQRPLLFQRELGKPLKAALDHICLVGQSIECLGTYHNHQQSIDDSFSVIDVYFQEIVEFLNHDGIRIMKMEDFELICEAIGIPSVSGTFSKSEMEWWQQLNNGRVDAGWSEKITSTEEKSKFLFTLGTRPFWELWQGQNTRKCLTREEFKHIIVERWRKHCRRDRKFSTDKKTSAAELNGNKWKSRVNFKTDNSSMNSKNNMDDHCKETFKNGNQIMKRVAATARRFISVRQIVHQICPRRKGAFLDSKKSIPRSENQLNGQKGPQYLHLEAQLYNQQKEINHLKTIVAELKSNLQLSDALNLAMEIYLKKISQSDVRKPGDFLGSYVIPISSAGNSPTDQLESLVNELKVISQTMYPTSSTLTIQRPDQNSYSKPSFYRHNAQNRCNISNFNNNYLSNSHSFRR